MPNPWEFVGYIPQGPQGETGEQGDRYLVYGSRDDVVQTLTLYRQLQAWDGAAYVNSGDPEIMGVVNDGQVQVGFYLPYMVDNGDSTITFWRQYYCRRDSNSNIFDPQGDPETIGTIQLPIGPQGHPGGYYQITSTNPDPNQYNAYFWREYHQWNAVSQVWEPTGVVEQIGGVVGTPGPRGEKGMYYKITTTNPDASTVEFYRRLYDPILQVNYGDLELIGSAIAVQGAQGEPGPQGPEGPGQVTIINQFPNQLPQLGEWVSWSYAAKKIVEYAAGIILRHYENPATAEYWVSVLHSFGNSYLPLETVQDMLNLASPSVIDELYDPVVLDNAAKALYCQMVQNYQLTDSQIVGMHHALGPYSNYWSNPATAHTFLAAYILASAAKNTTEMELFRANVAYHRARAVGRTAPDYSSESCTPAYEDWNHVWDFTLGEQGWMSGLGSYASHIASEGWANNGSGWLGIFIPFSAPVRLIQIEVITVNAQTRRIRLTADGTQTSAGNEIVTLDETNQTPSIFTWHGDRTLGTLGVHGYNWYHTGPQRVSRVSVSGLGAKPPGLI